MPHTKALKIASDDQALAIRLVSALVRRWDSLPVETQRLLIKDAASLGQGADTVQPAKLMSFIELYKRASR